MGQLSISETQFAFTYFHKFCLLQKSNLHDFIFPSLKQEGNPFSKYAGADLVISKNLFIQFKIPEILLTKGTKEFYSGNAEDLFDAPFFRVRIKNKLLSGKKNSGQFQMLQRVARSGKTAQYIFPVFDFKIEGDNPLTSNYWFLNFVRQTPSVSLDAYCLSIDFADMLDPIFDLDNSDTHTLCTDYEKGMKGGDVYLFSEAKYVPAQSFITSMNYENESFNWKEEEERTIPQTVNDLIEVFYLQEEKIETLDQLQNYLLIHYDIFWVPIIKKKN